MYSFFYVGVEYYFKVNMSSCPVLFDVHCGRHEISLSYTYSHMHIKPLMSLTTKIDFLNYPLFNLMSQHVVKNTYIATKSLKLLFKSASLG